MLWPLLGLGFGSEGGDDYVRLFYFLKLGGGDGEQQPDA